MTDKPPTAEEQLTEEICQKLKQIETTLLASRDTISALLEYAQHGLPCDAMESPAQFLEELHGPERQCDPRCTCGLREAVRKAKELL